MYWIISLVQSLSHVQLFATPWTAACQAPLSMGFLRQEYWSGLPFSSQGESSRPRYQVSPALAGGFFIQIGGIKISRKGMKTCAFYFFIIYLFIFIIIILLYNIILVLPYINMNPPRVYTCSPSWTPLPPQTIPLGHPGAPAPSTLYHALNLDWRFVSHMILYMFQCHFPKWSHPRLLPQSTKDCSIHLCLFCCLAYRVIVTIFLNSIYMR